MKVFIGFLLTLIVLSAATFWGYQILMKRQESGSAATPFNNPFTEKPSTSFDVASDTSNPFAEPTPQNPFGSKQSQTYKNPFEVLR